MKRLLKIVGIIILAIILVCGSAYLLDREPINQWTLTTNHPDSNQLSWSPFEWGAYTTSGKFFDKSEMMLAGKIKGLPYQYKFQFDLGAQTIFYEKNIESIPGLQNKTRRFKSPLIFWNRRQTIKDVELSFGDITTSTTNAMIERNYGWEVSTTNLDDSSVLQVGTIGIEFVRDHILIIDYPNKRFSICDSLPPAYNTKFVDIELDKIGRAILPMKLKGKTYRIMFDNGSSLFPLITLAKNISNFSTSQDIDTLRIRSWGKEHDVTGKMMTDTFELGGQTFSNVKVYANHSGYGIDPHTDGMTGNALFWDKTIIIDFKNKKFGVK